MGETRGCNCARKVMAHMIYMDMAESISVDLQTLFPQLAHGRMKGGGGGGESARGGRR